MEDKTIFRQEYYVWSYNDLVKVIGEGMVKRLVTYYQSSRFSGIPIIKSSMLLKTYQEEFGTSSVDFSAADLFAVFTTAPPLLSDLEYYDPTDKGVTPMPQQTGNGDKNKRTKSARRARRNG